MRLALVSDIHGNLAALETVIADIGQMRVDRTVCLGDVALTGPQPAPVLERLHALGWPTVMGNADALILEPAFKPNDARINDLDAWCVAQLQAEHLEFVRGFQPTIEFELDGPKPDQPEPSGRHLLCFHGSPRNFNDIILADTPAETLEGLLTARAPVMAGGHTHRTMLRRHGDALILNPGSVGMAYASVLGEGTLGAYAEYLILDTHPALRLEFRRVPFDATRVAGAFRAASTPHAEFWAGEWLNARA